MEPNPIAPYPPKEGELESLYQVFSSQKIAALLAELGQRVSKPTVLRWIRTAGIPRRDELPPSPPPAPKCPFSALRLRELYWQEGRTLKDLAEVGSAILGVPVSDDRAGKWLEEAGISKRTTREVNKLLSRRDIAKYRALARQNGAAQEGKQRGRPLTDAQRRKAARRAAQARAARVTYETRPCAVCGSQVTRRKSQFTTPHSRTACSMRCAATLRHIPKRENN